MDTVAATDSDRLLTLMGRVWLTMIPVGCASVIVAIGLGGALRYLAVLGFVGMAMLRWRWDRLAGNYSREMVAAEKRPLRGISLVNAAIAHAVRGS